MFPSLCVCVAPPRPHFREDAGMCKINRQQMPRSRPAGPSVRTCRPCAASLRVLETGAKMRPRCALSRDFSTSAPTVDVRRPCGPRTSRSATGFATGQLTHVRRHHMLKRSGSATQGAHVVHRHDGQVQVKVHHCAEELRASFPRLVATGSFIVRCVYFCLKTAPTDGCNLNRAIKPGR